MEPPQPRHTMDTGARDAADGGDDASADGEGEYGYDRAVGRTTTAISWGATALLTAVVGCGGTATSPRASDDGGPYAVAEAAAETGGPRSDDAQSDAAIDASGPDLCVALGGQCYFGAFTCDYSPSVPVDCGPDGLCCTEDVTYPDGSGAPADECIKAGGQCKVGPFPCAVSGRQSCGPQGTGGSRCCLVEPDE